MWPGCFQLLCRCPARLYRPTVAIPDRCMRPNANATGPRGQFAHSCYGEVTLSRAKSRKLHHCRSAGNQHEQPRLTGAHSRNGRHSSAAFFGSAQLLAAKRIEDLTARSLTLRLTPAAHWCCFWQHLLRGTSPQDHHHPGGCHQMWAPPVPAGQSPAGACRMPG